MSEAEAILIIIDNTETSINGDFYPNRLNAQKIAAERLFQYFVRKSSQTQIAIATLGTKYFGLQTSLTCIYPKISKSIAQIKYGGENDFEHMIRCGFLTLKHRDARITVKRMIVFMCSRNNFNEEKAQILAADANRENVSIDIIAFGDDVNNVDVLQNFVESLHMKSYFIRANPGNMILSDIVLSSRIGTGRESYHDDMEDEIDDPSIAMAIRQSLGNAHTGDDPELRAAIKSSLEEAQSKGYGLGEDEDELMEAIRLSLMEEQIENTNLRPKTIQEEKETHDDLKNQIPNQNEFPFKDDPSFKTFMDAFEKVDDDEEMRKALLESFLFERKKEPESPLQFFYKIDNEKHKEEQSSDDYDDEDEDDPLTKALLETIKENERNNQGKK